MSHIKLFFLSVLCILNTYVKAQVKPIETKPVDGKDLYKKIISSTARKNSSTPNILSRFSLSDIIPSSGAHLIGEGINEFSGTFTGGNKIKNTSDANLRSDGNAQTVTFELIKIENATDLQKALNLDVTVSLGFGIFSSSASYNLYNSLKQDSYKKYLLVKVNVLNSPQILKEVAFKDGFIDGLYDDEDDSTTPYERFRKEAGSKFIIGKITGGSLYGVIEMEGSDVEEENRMSADIDASVGVFASGQAQLSEKLNRFSSYSNLHILVSKNGGNTTQSTSIKALIDDATGFPAQVVTSKNVVYNVLSPYDGVPGYPSEFFNSMHSQKEFVVKKLIAKAANDKRRLDTYLNDYQFVADHQNEFVIAPDFSVVRGNKTQSINDASENLYDFLENVRNKYLYNDANNTEPIYPNIPAVETFSRNPNYHAIKGDLFVQKISNYGKNSKDLHEVRCSNSSSNCIDGFEVERISIVNSVSTKDGKHYLKNFRVKAIAGDNQWNSNDFRNTISYVPDNLEHPQQVTCYLSIGSRIVTVEFAADEYEIMP